MSQKIVIDNLAFAKKHETLTGNILLNDCPRLQTLLQDLPQDAMPKSPEPDAIQFQLTGKSNSANQYFLSLHIEALLTTTCQRCLNAMPLKRSLSFNYLISDAPDDELDALTDDELDDYDIQQANSAMDVITLIEDELIMAMPIAPTHEVDCVKLVTQSGEKPNPFAVLKGLVKK